jgi:probable rRNA maturation factor
MVDLVFNNKSWYKNLSENYLNEIISIVLDFLKIETGTVELSLNFVNSDKMRELNREYRDKDKTTDVLSFPLDDDKLKSYGIMPLGDIFVCPDFIKENHQNDIDEEVIRAIVHGLLHLLGYDHEIAENDAGRMLDFQEKILKRILNK